MPGTPDTVLAFDYGQRRIGVAVGQTVTRSATPLGVISNSPDGPDWLQLGALLKEWRPTRLIVGLPTHADGSKSETTAYVEQFVTELQRYQLPISLQDERYSSVEARQMLKAGRAAGGRGRVSKEMVDSASAVLIAERWLNKNSHPMPGISE
jgi:putative Holliday junction resolvase